MQIFATTTTCSPLGRLLERLKMTKFRLLLEFLQFIMQISPYFTHDDKKITKIHKFFISFCRSNSSELSNLSQIKLIKV